MSAGNESSSRKTLALSSTEIAMLAAEQTALLQEFRDRWAAVRVATAPVDRTAAEEGVKLAYRAAGLAPVGRIEWCAGPFEMARQWGRAQRGCSIGANVRTVLAERARARSDRALQPRLRPGVRNAVIDGVRSAPIDSVSREVMQAITRRVWPARPHILTRIWELAASLVRRKPNWRNWSTGAANGIGQHELSWLAAYEYLHDVCHLQNETEMLRGLWLIGANAGWVLPHENVCWLAERHNVLHFDARGRLHCATGPALAYPDGWSYYAWKGVEVPAELIEQPELITVDEIDRQGDMFVRRCMIEIMTPKRFVECGGAKVISRDETGILWRAFWWNGEAWAAVEVVNGTPGPNGKHQSYFLQVPPELRSARAAVAWTYGIPEHQYACLAVRT